MESGRTHVEVDKRIANASKAFGALRRAVFKDAHLSVATRRSVYRACVLSVLLYGSECWVPLRKDLKKLNSFHHRCVPHSAGHHQPEAVGGAHLIYNGERVMGRCRDHNRKTIY